MNEPANHITGETSDMKTSVTITPFVRPRRGTQHLSLGIASILLVLGAGQAMAQDVSYKGKRINAITKRKERIRGDDAPATAFTRLVSGDERGIEPAHLTGANAHNAFVGSEHNGVRLDVFTGEPAKA